MALINAPILYIVEYLYVCLFVSVRVPTVSCLNYAITKLSMNKTNETAVTIEQATTTDAYDCKIVFSQLQKYNIIT